MPQVTRRGANQLRNLMFHLELATIHTQHVPVAAVYNIGERLHCSRLPSTTGAQEQEYSHGTALGRQPRLVHLYVGRYAGSSRGLANDPLRQHPGKIYRTRQIFVLMTFIKGLHRKRTSPSTL